MLPVTPRARVIIDNDFAGDPDDLFALAHQLLSPSTTVPFVIGSHLSVGDPFDSSEQQAEHAVAIACELIELIGLGGRVPVHQGSNQGLHAVTEPLRSPASDAIIAEALREDTDLPLFATVGGGLTDLASALMLEPRVADRMTVVWVGGAEHPGEASPHPGDSTIEYNLNIDVSAAQYVFNHSSVRLWQVPRNVYRQALVSLGEIDARVRPLGQLGSRLAGAIEGVREMAAAHGFNLGETYALGDSPLVLLTALQSPFEPDPASSTYVTVPTPTLQADGSYAPNPEGRPMRLYRTVDTRLMFEDMFTKLADFARRSSGSSQPAGRLGA